MPRDSASVRACGLIACAARMPRQSPSIRSRYRESCSTASIVPTRLISTATQSPLSSRHMRSTGPMSVGHSRRTSRSFAPRTSGRAASSSCRCRSTPSFWSATDSPMSWVTSLSTSAIRISRRSSDLPARLRTTMRPSSSSTMVGGVIQFNGLKPPASSCTRNEPSALNMSKRTASGSRAVSRPVYSTSQRATRRRMPADRTVRFGQGV